MPELPEVETVRRGLAPVLEGRRLVRTVARRPDLRFPLPDGFGQRLTGRTVAAVNRRAKFLLIELDDEATLIAHLGMTGSFRIYENDPPPLEKHDHVIFRTDLGAEIRFNDPRRFGFTDASGVARYAHLRQEGSRDPDVDGSPFVLLGAPIGEARFAQQYIDD